MVIQWAVLGAAAATVVGLIEWCKYLAPRAPRWVWHVALLPACALVGAVLDGGLGASVLHAGLLLLLTQVGYQVVVQGAVEWIKAAAELIKRKAGT